ncbi:MAG: Lrp/AsnC family transcriptional regulator [Candidatus Lokiarchaeota archaeon]|nr:Lrp/AsnC family transcriptional regulator [Candidatus Lokiarchaeota archaeon]
MTKNVQAYILMDIELGKTDSVVDKLRSIDEAIRVSITTGIFDVIVLIEVPDLEALYDITVHKIHTIPGIKQTTTAVIEKMIE